MALIRVPLRIKVTIKTKDGTDIKDVAEEIIKANFDVTPMKVTVNSPHGAYMEYGTGPAKHRGTKVPGQPTAVQLRFRQWAAIKCKAAAAAAGMSTDRFGDMVYNKIMREGMKEHPFFRPAIYEVVDNIGSYFVKGGSGTHGMAEDVRTLAENNLLLNDSIYTGELINSIEVHELTEPISDEPPTQEELEIWDRISNKDGDRKR